MHKKPSTAFGPVTCVPVTSTRSSLNLRPEAPEAERRQVMLSPADVAAAILYVLDVPAHVRIDELVISPMSQA